ncbi:hypothetical protein JQ629_14690 [Bradyrhizobium sp. AUGA SZCCT0222]|uniref:hypothetical protein n=1 Tax=Bradyrhizobium sp. AUGA SZCCT0222 TaxID=2807668 RepID=UPI001BA9D80D|nr:hypothetical protein [Bradyrhizobium sp. AUGA SZCCT0222]MBR1268757.1 hypothetical protein [Bradyrhizobium sp. AUGA SZCCT0222]
MKASPPKTPENAAEKQLKRGFLCHLDETGACPERCFRCGGPMGTAVNCPSIDGIIQKVTKSWASLRPCWKQR